VGPSTPPKGKTEESGPARSGDRDREATPSRWPIASGTASDRPGPASDQYCRMVAAEELDSADSHELMSSLPSDLSDDAELEAWLEDVDVRAWGGEGTAAGTVMQLEPRRAVVSPARPVTLSYSVATQVARPPTSEAAVQRQPVTRAASVNTSHDLAASYIDLPDGVVLDDILHATAERPGGSLESLVDHLLVGRPPTDLPRRRNLLYLVGVVAATRRAHVREFRARVEEARGNSDVGRQLLQQAEIARQDAFENWAVPACSCTASIVRTSSILTN